MLWLGRCVTPAKSAESAKELLLDPGLSTGEVYGHDAKLYPLVWAAARDPNLARRVVDESSEFLTRAAGSSSSEHAAYT